MKHYLASIFAPFPFSPVLITLSIVFLGTSLQIHDGLYDLIALRYLSAGIACAVLAVLFPTSSPNPSLMHLGCLCAIACFAWQLSHTAPLKYSRDPDASANFSQFIVPCMIICTAGILFIPTRVAPWCVLALALLFVSTGAWLLRTSPDPFIDVHVVTRDACHAAAKGINPYSITFPDIYKSYNGAEQSFYPAGMIVNGRIQFGYQYTPLSFMIGFIGYLVSGDYRLGNLAAVALASVLLAFSGRTRLACLAAALLLFMPRTFFVLEQGWSEPAVVVTMALVVCCALRHKALLPFAVGAMLVSKQHMFLIAPLVLLLIPKPWTLRRITVFASKALIAGAVISLPLILWNVRAFWHSAIDVQLKNPFRTDSLNYAAWWFEHYHQQAPVLVSLGLALAAGLVCLWRAPRTPSGFALSAAVVYLSFFAMAKQAFCNYYFMIIAALCCALAASAIKQVQQSPTPGDAI